MTLRWVAVNLLTRQIVCDLPSLESQDPFRRTIGQYETSTATLTVSSPTNATVGGDGSSSGVYGSGVYGSGIYGSSSGGGADISLGGINPDWEQGILEGATACIAYTGDPGHEVVVWGGIVNQAPRTLGDTIQLSLITVEGYLDRCYTGAYTTDPGLTGVTRDQNLIATDLVTQFAAGTVAGIPGLPIVCQVNGPAGPPLLRQYNDYDDKTVYSTLQDLTNAVGGIEWTMHWVWSHSPDLITPYFYVGTPTATTYGVGSRMTAGLGPNVTFDETLMTDATIPHDWSSGAGGNIVTATGPGNGLARAVSQVIAPVTHGRPHYELRFAPSTSIFDPLTIGQHASQALTIVQSGSQVLSCTVQAGLPGTSLGTDFNLGDDVGFTIEGVTIPNRITVTGRMISYEATDTTITPHLYAPTVS